MSKTHGIPIMRSSELRKLVLKGEHEHLLKRVEEVEGYHDRYTREKAALEVRMEKQHALLREGTDEEEEVKERLQVLAFKREELENWWADTEKCPRLTRVEEGELRTLVAAGILNKLRVAREQQTEEARIRKVRAKLVSQRRVSDEKSIYLRARARQKRLQALEQGLLAAKTEQEAREQELARAIGELEEKRQDAGLKQRDPAKYLEVSERLMQLYEEQQTQVQVHEEKVQKMEEELKESVLTQDEVMAIRGHEAKVRAKLMLKSTAEKEGSEEANRTVEAAQRFDQLSDSDINKKLAELDDRMERLVSKDQQRSLRRRRSTVALSTDLIKTLNTVKWQLIQIKSKRADARRARIFAKNLATRLGTAGTALAARLRTVEAQLEATQAELQQEGSSRMGRRNLQDGKAALEAERDCLLRELKSPPPEQASLQQVQKKLLEVQGEVRAVEKLRGEYVRQKRQDRLEMRSFEDEENETSHVIGKQLQDATEQVAALRERRAEVLSEKHQLLKKLCCAGPRPENHLLELTPRSQKNRRLAGMYYRGDKPSTDEDRSAILSMFPSSKKKKKPSACFRHLTRRRSSVRVQDLPALTGCTLGRTVLSGAQLKKSADRLHGESKLRREKHEKRLESTAPAPASAKPMFDKHIAERLHTQAAAEQQRVHRAAASKHSGKGAAAGRLLNSKEKLKKNNERLYYDRLGDRVTTKERLLGKYIVKPQLKVAKLTEKQRNDAFLCLHGAGGEPTPPPLVQA